MGAVTETNYIVAQGEYELRRFPRIARDQLRAWDAADELLLSQLADLLDLSDDAIAIVNDGFGALSVPLATFSPVVINDSWVSQCGISSNLEDNGLNSQRVQMLDSLASPLHKFDLILVKVPKNLGYLEDQLIRLKDAMNPGCTILLGGMIKHLPGTLWKLLEKILGPTETSLGVKKAKVIKVKYDPENPVKRSPYPTEFRLEGTELSLRNHSNVFSRDSLDIGARFFLQHLPVNKSAKQIVDLGCGNGVLGLMMAKTHIDSELVFVDESYMAVESARLNFETAYPNRGNAKFLVGDCLEKLPDQSADIILCNPPFHQQTAVSDHTALVMFKDSRRVLANGGSLYVIGNRHLGYHVKLKRFFSNIQQIAANKKFVILRCNQG